MPPIRKSVMIHTITKLDTFLKSLKEPIPVYLIPQKTGIDFYSVKLAIQYISPEAKKKIR